MLMSSGQIDGFADFRGRDETGTGINDVIFFTIINGTSDLKEAVVRVQVLEWVDQLHRNEKCSELFHDILNIVTDCMLVVDPQSRYTADSVCQELKECFQKARISEHYMLKPTHSQTFGKMRRLRRTV